MPEYTPELRAELDAVMAKADKHGWAVDEDGDLVLRVPTCWKEGAWQDKAGRDNAAAIVALHNAYPLLTATIDAQAAEIARLREALAAMLLTHDAGGVTLGAAKDARAALASTGAA